MKFIAVGLFVSDMSKMVSFYRDVMDMQTDWKDNEPNAQLESDGFCLIMYGRKDFEKMTSQKYGYPKGTNGTMELAYEVKDFASVDAEYKRVVSLGAKPVMPPATEPWGQRTCYVADPEGNLVEIGSFNKG